MRPAALLNFWIWPAIKKVWPALQYLMQTLLRVTQVVVFDKIIFFLVWFYIKGAPPHFIQFNRKILGNVGEQRWTRDSPIFALLVWWCKGNAIVQNSVSQPRFRGAQMFCQICNSFPKTLSEILFAALVLNVWKLAGHITQKSAQFDSEMSIY